MSSSHRRRILKGQQPTPKPRLAIPKISVTGNQDIMGSHHFPPLHPSTRRVPRVHLIGNPSNSFVTPHDIVVGKAVLYDDVTALLQDGFYVQNGKTCYRSKSQTSDTQQTAPADQRPLKQRSLEQYDVCVYLFTKATVEDPDCFYQLFVAIALKIPVIFIRNHNDDLPPNFAECIRKNSHGCISLREFIDKYVWGSHDPPKQNFQRRNRLIRANHRLSPPTVKSQPSTKSDLNIRGVDIRKIRRLQDSSDDCDLTLFLLHCYKNAFVFDRKDKQRCSEMLKTCILNFVDNNSHLSDSGSLNYPLDKHQDQLRSKTVTPSQIASYENTVCYSQSSGQNKADSFLRIPESSVAISTREWGTSGSVSAPPIYHSPVDGRYSYDLRMVTPLPIEEKTTTYLIFTNERSTDKIRKINYPVRSEDMHMLPDTCNDSDSDEFETGESPIQISDIDLGREVNKVIDSLESDNIL